MTRPGFEASEVETAFTVHGFNLTGTGGNCTAFIKPLANGRHILITEEDGPCAPESINGPMCAGLYSDADIELLDQFVATDLDNALAVITAKGWQS